METEDELSEISNDSPITGVLLAAGWLHQLSLRFVIWLRKQL